MDIMSFFIEFHAFVKNFTLEKQNVLLGFRILKAKFRLGSSLVKHNLDIG